MAMLPPQGSVPSTGTQAEVLKFSFVLSMLGLRQGLVMKRNESGSVLVLLQSTTLFAERRSRVC